MARFRARHHLVGDFGAASEPHEHDYRMEVAVRGDGLREDGTLFDITRLQSALGQALSAVEGRDLNEVEELAPANPTAEAVARYLFEKVAPSLVGAVDTLSVRLWESDDAYAAYTGRLA